jgi:hypothetical protein
MARDGRSPHHQRNAERDGFNREAQRHRLLASEFGAEQLMVTGSSPSV